MQAKKSLSGDALIAIQTWQSSSWHLNAMQRSHKENDGGVFDEIYNAFAPVRQLMTKLYGNTIELHRGIKLNGNTSHMEGRTLFSWTLDLDTANSFSGKGVQKPMKTLTPDEISKLVAKYNQTGYVSAFGYQLIRNKYSPEYFDMWKNRELITDGDDVEKFLNGVNQERIEWNNRGEGKGRVTTKAIPVETILWMAHELGSAEFIVMGDAG